MRESVPANADQLEKEKKNNSQQLNKGQPDQKPKYQKHIAKTKFCYYGIGWKPMHGNTENCTLPPQANNTLHVVSNNSLLELIAH